MATRCPALDTPNTQWNFCPNLPAAYVLTVFFGLTTFAHLFQAIHYRKPYCWVIVASGLAQTINYIFRIVSILNPAIFSDYVIWFVLILIAPLFTNAFVYMIMGRMVWNYISTAKIYGIAAWRLGSLFVLLDIIALVVQVYGAAAAASATDSNGAKALHSLHVYMVGVGIQQGFILLFGFFAIRFHLILYKQEATKTSSSRSIHALLYTIYAVLILITIRIVFRLVEYSQGLTSSIPNHEAYQYCLDSLPMLLALVLLNVVHPGRIMRGKECDIPGRKERKQRKQKNERKERKIRSTHAKHEMRTIQTSEDIV